MKWPRIALILVVLTASLGGARVKAAQPGNGEEIKVLGTTLPEGRGSVRLSAMSMDRDRSPPVIHLKGNVRVEMVPAPSRGPHKVIVLRADEADFYEQTGEIQPRGNVRVTVEEPR
jgi:hypothetical protein